MKKEGYEERVKREESTHAHNVRAAEIKRGWSGLSDKEHAQETAKIDSLNYHLWRAGFTDG